MQHDPAARRHRILVAEDDPDVRDLAVGVLEGAGYSVIAAPSGEAALSYLTEYDDVSLLLTDIRMPGTVDGWALAARAKACWPELRVIYMTGFGAVPVNVGHGPLLPKPWTAHQLLDCVREVLSGPADGGSLVRC